MSVAKVSVIVPVYNTEQYLPKCIESILKQDLTEIEIICIDDNSDDNSLDILERYAKKDARLKVVKQENGNIGPGAARNKAIDMASGEYIAFVDSDDYIATNMLGELYEPAVQNDADVVICTIKKFTEDHRDKFPNCVYDKHMPARLESRSFTWIEIQDIIFKLRFSCVNKIYKQTFLDDYNIRFSEGIFYEDMIFTYKALLSARSMRFVRKDFVFNRKQRVGATTYSQSSRAYDAFIALKEVEDFIDAKPELHILKKRFEAFKFKKLLKYLPRNDAKHIENFYQRLKEFVANSDLENNPHLNDRYVKILQDIKNKTLTEYLLDEYWELTNENAFLKRDNSVRKLMLKIKGKMSAKVQNAVKGFKKG